MLDIPKKYYDQEGFFSLMGIGYTAALATTGLGILNSVGMLERINENLANPTKRAMVSVGMIGGGALATWGYLKASGVLY
jgi:hypothetical protein